MAIVTISRGSYSGGKAVAELLARQMGGTLLSREQVLAEAARDYGISEKELAAALNQSPPFWQQVLGKRLAYVRCVTAVLLDHVRQDNVVYHGYVGHLLLAGISHVLRVRIVADLETRIRSAMEQASLSRQQAIAHIHRVDKDRARWARMLYGVQWDDPRLYDLTVNLEHLSPQGACAIIMRAAQLPEFARTPESLKRLEDMSLSCRIWAALARNPETRGAGVQITADDGKVSITGSVRSSHAVELIPALARQAEGVKRLDCTVGVGSDWHW